MCHLVITMLLDYLDEVEEVILFILDKQTTSTTC